jgi:small-conductance mechanosensitive channel
MNSSFNKPSNKYKRKGSDFAPSSETTVVTRSVVYQKPSTSWQESQSKLASLRERLQKEDNDEVWSILQNCLTHESSIKEAESVMLAESSATQKKLDVAVQEAAEQCKEESEALYQLQTALHKLHAERDAMLADLSATDQQTEELNQDIIRYQQEANEEMGAIDSVEESAKKSVPRLQYLISLYASCTGIKWDFDQERLLEGEVVRTYFGIFPMWKCGIDRLWILVRRMSFSLP